MTMDLFLVSLVLGAGLALGAARPTIAVGLLVALVAPLSSLPWQLERSNLSLPTVYVLALVAGTTIRAIVDPVGRAEGLRRLRATGWASTFAAMLVVTLAVASTLAVGRSYALTPTTFLSILRSEGELLALFNPSGPAGQIQAAWIAASGPLIFLVTAALMAGEPSRRFIYRCFLTGGLVAILSPVAQALFLSPWVRADQDMRRYWSTSGFFQDPNSYAAFLLVALGLSTNLAFRGLRFGRDVVAGIWVAVAVVGMVSLFLSGSRSGLILGVLVVVVTAWLTRVDQGKSPQATWTRRTLARTGATALAVLLVLGALVRVGSVDRVFTDQLHRNRVVRTFDADKPTRWSVQLRLELWKQALGAMAQRPLFGIGPRTFVTLEGVQVDDAEAPRADNAHNYLLQLGAEYGLPALALLLAFLASVTSRIVSGLGGSAGPPALPGILAAHLGVVGACLIAHPLLLMEIQAPYWALLALGTSIADPAA